MKALITLLFAFVLVASEAIAGDCRLTGSVCVDTSPTKVVSGITVTLAQIGGCWEYEDTYECVGEHTYDYCAALEATPGCALTSNRCTSTAFDGSCQNNLKTFRCGNPISNAEEVVLLDKEYTVVFDGIDYSPCSGYADDSTCTLAGKVCVEGAETRNIEGQYVYKDCWRWKEDYTCVVSTARNYCEPLERAGCRVTQQSCSRQAYSGECIENTNNYHCGAPLNPLPTDIVHLNSSYTIVTDTTDLSQCVEFSGNPNCTEAEKVCIDGPGTKHIDGFDVYRDCWEWKQEYSCASEELTSTCDDLRSNPQCVETVSACIDFLPAGQCGLVEREFRCMTAPPTTTTVTDCGLQTFCVNGTCFDTGYPPDGDFGRAIAMMEVVREAANYDIFKGDANECSSNVLNNCCKSQGGGQGGRNDAIASSIGSTVLEVGREQIHVWGSRYLFEGLGTGAGGQMLQEYAWAALGNGAISMTGSFSVWGAQFAVSQSGIAYVGFDPWSLVFAIAVYVITEMMQCESDEQALAMKRGQGLCHKVGSYCASKVLGRCVKKKEAWCCFPSKLGRIINEQGRAQIGRSWGTPKRPDCNGFTLDELALLRFDEMDLSEFIADIIPSGKSTTYAVDRLQEKARSYYGP